MPVRRKCLKVLKAAQTLKKLVKYHYICIEEGFLYYFVAVGEGVLFGAGLGAGDGERLRPRVVDGEAGR